MIASPLRCDGQRGLLVRLPHPWQFGDSTMLAATRSSHVDSPCIATLGGTMPLARVTQRLREGLRRRRELGNDADFDRVWPSFDEELYGSSYGALRLSVVLDDLLESIPELRSGGVSILDAGGGSGRLAVRLAALGNEVVLCDPSAKMLDEARVAVDAAGLAHAVTLVQARIQDLHTLDREFDLITCHVVLNWLAEPEEALNALTQRLSSGGRLSLMFVNHNAFLLHRIQRGDFSEALDDWRPDGVKPPHASKMRLSRLSHLPTGWSYAAWGARAVPLSENVVREWLDRLDFVVESKAGVRMFHDYVPESHRTPDRLEDLLALERALRGTEPFASLGEHVHLICAPRQSESHVPQEGPQACGNHTARRRSVRLVRPATRKTVSASVAVALVIILLSLVALPEALGDRPYDPRPSRVIHDVAA